MVDERPHVVGHDVIKCARLNHLAEMSKVCLAVKHSGIAFQYHVVAISVAHLNGTHRPLLGFFMLVVVLHRYLLCRCTRLGGPTRFG